MKKCFILTIAMLLFIILSSTYCFSQQQGFSNSKQADSLLKEINNTIYSRIYNPRFWSKCNVATFTVLKVSIDKEGVVTEIGFSDSADSLFVKTYFDMPKYHDDKMTLQRYAKAYKLKDVALLFPINFEPMADKTKGCNSYKKMEILFQFKQIYFTGKSIIMKAIRIPVGSENNN